VKLRGLALRSVPWLTTILILGAVFWVVPFYEVWKALGNARTLPYFMLMAPYSLAFFLVDTFCLTTVIRWFNCPVAYRDILPVRAVTYLLSIVNSSLGQGGVALYLNRRERIPLLEVTGSVVFLGFVEIYQLTFYSSVGFLLAPAGYYLPLRPVYVALYGYLAAHLLIFSLKPRWLAFLYEAKLLKAFSKAEVWRYLLLLAYKSPNFLMAVLVHYFALKFFDIDIPILDLLLFLPIIFFCAALPIGVAHLGTPQLAWVYFFNQLRDYASAADLLAYSLSAHFTFMLANGTLGLFFLPRAARELWPAGASRTRSEKALGIRRGAAKT